MGGGVEFFFRGGGEGTCVCVCVCETEFLQDAVCLMWMAGREGGKGGGVRGVFFGVSFFRMQYVQ